MKDEAETPKKISVKKASDFSEWYTQVLINSEFVDYSAVSGMLVYRPDSYFAWDTIKEATDKLFKEVGVQDVYFPILIPERFLLKEKEHIEHFSPEVAWVTHGGDTELGERLAVRPTSETIMYDSFSKWIRSWRDLPLLYNIWASVVRWEFKHPTPFLRNREFLWNEGHSVFASKEEADKERDVILGIYDKVLREYLALPGIIGRKTDSEKFAGAAASYSIEHIMPDGWAIQGPAHHSDEQNFSKSFNIQFIDRDGEKKYAYQNTYAISTREIGTMIMTHGDDKGLVIPPRLSRIQAVVVPIYTNVNKDEILEYAGRVYDEVKRSSRAYLDSRDEYSPGWKFNEWEIKGVPIRIEVGKRELESKSVVVVRRDNGSKEKYGFEGLGKFVGQVLTSIHESMYEKAEQFLKSHIFEVENYDGLKATVGKGFAQAPWCGEEECEAKIKEETGAKATNMPDDIQSKAEGKECVRCGKKARYIVNFAKSY